MTKVSSSKLALLRILNLISLSGIIVLVRRLIDLTHNLGVLYDSSENLASPLETQNSRASSPKSQQVVSVSRNARNILGLNFSFMSLCSSTLRSL